MTRAVKSIDLEFTVLEFREDFVLSFPAEDVIVEQKELEKLIEVCTNFYQDQEFVYISQRVNRHNVNPTIYFGLERVKNLLGIAVVCNESGKIKTANFEKAFSKVPFEVFPEFEEALDWKNELLKK